MKPIQRIFITRDGGQLWHIPLSAWEKQKTNYVREGYRAATMNEIEKAGVMLKEVNKKPLKQAKKATAPKDIAIEKTQEEEE